MHYCDYFARPKPKKKIKRSEPLVQNECSTVNYPKELIKSKFFYVSVMKELIVD
ncbi:MAG: hypothetical protein HeimC3_14390 [Candidatus Heimdallarchaeota archaeon LC_3]|nr:MAG: hypothetical protein HeimC3_14390 [Candidatus Heimdallarchaeota archaeon LC_3]